MSRLVHDFRLSRLGFSPIFSLKFLAIVAVLLVPCLWVPAAHSLTITLAWDPNDESDLAGYRVFARVEGESYDYQNPEWQGPETTCTLPNLADNTNYYFVARAFDTGGNESGDSNEVYYQAPQNAPPIADAGPDQTLSEGATVTLDGSNSSDPDGVIVSFEWIQISGTPVTLSDATSPTPWFTAPFVGITGEALTFELTVTDNDGSSDTDTVIINVSNVNQAPIADAGSDATVTEGATVNLDGSNSSDPDGVVVSYSWSQTAGPIVTLSDPLAAQPSFIALDIGPNGESLTFQLTVTDDGGLQATDTCIVNITWVNLPPVADAGIDQTVDEGASVVLNGSNSNDPDDTIASHLWTQTTGTAVTLSDPGSPTPQFTAPSVDVGGEALTFRLTVTDSGGLSDSDTVIINVSDVNQAPTADAGPDQTVTEADTVTLDGSNSSDPDGIVVSYSWSQTAGPAVALSDPLAAQPTFLALDVGPNGESLTFELTVTDNGGLQATDSCIVNITWVNLPPVADAGVDQTVDEGASVVLNGSNSSDPDDTIASYLWTQTTGTPVTLSDPTSPTPGFTAPAVDAGSEALTFQLTVTDSGGLSDTDTVIINVSNVNQAPTADTGPDQTVTEGDTVTLDGSNSSDPDGSIVSHSWSQITGPTVTLSDPLSVQPSFVAPDVGPNGESLTFQLTVTDNGGLQAADICIVNVSWDNIPPVADAGIDQTITEGASVVLDGSNSSDPDDTIVSYLWTQTAGTSVTLYSPTSPTPWFNAPLVDVGGEALTFRLTVTDSGGLTDSDTVIVNVSNFNQEPLADAGPDQTVNEGDTVTLDGSNSVDPDGSVVSYSWSQLAGPSVTLSDPSSALATFVAPDVGPSGESLTFLLTVTDDGGLQSTDFCVVNVSWVDDTPPAPPTGLRIEF